MAKKPDIPLEDILDPYHGKFPDAGMVSFERAAAQLEALLDAGISVSQRIFIAIFPAIDAGHMIKQWMKRGYIPAAKVKGRWTLSEDYCRDLVQAWRNDPLKLEKRARPASMERTKRPMRPSRMKLR